MTKWVSKFNGNGYGTKLDLPDSPEGNKILLIMVEPGRSTAQGYDEKHLKRGLRDHPDEEWENVTFVNYVAPRATRDMFVNVEPLVYEFLREDGSVESRTFGPGQSLRSVDGIKGRFHRLKNVCDEYGEEGKKMRILLRIEFKKRLPTLSDTIDLGLLGYSRPPDRPL
jgi:hypothetical protein